jgi:hypothetical protein
LSSRNNINIVSDINPEIWKRQIPSNQRVKFTNVVFSSQPIWSNLYIFYGTNRSFVLPNSKAPRIYFSVEPRTLKENSYRFLKQFDSIYGSIPHKLRGIPNLITNQPALPWHIGINFDNPNGVVNLNFIDLFNIEPPKINGVSVITSNKIISKFHYERYIFIQKLSHIMGSSLHIYGRGFNPISDKFEVLRKFRYHIALENSQQESYWSEKLSDPIIALNKVFYFGAPNINEYFSTEVVKQINLMNPEKTAELILNEVNNNRWESDFNLILNEKEKVLNKFNFANLIFDLKYTPRNRVLGKIIISDFMIIPRRFFHKLRWLLKNRLMRINF